MRVLLLILLIGADAFAQVPDTLRQDVGVPTYIFRLPDAFGGDWRNQRFVAPETGQLVGAMFCFGGRTGEFTTGEPHPIWRIWPSDTDSLPDVNIELGTVVEEAPLTSYFPLDSVWSDASAPWVFVDLSHMDLRFVSGELFHIGFSLNNPAAGDSLAILADRGNPETTNASEWRAGRFHFLREGWRGVNLLIRALYLRDSAPAVEPLLPAGFTLSAWPNPFNATTRITWTGVPVDGGQLILQDVLGRHVGTWDASLSGGTMILDGTHWSSGFYFLSLSSSSAKVTRPLILLK